VKGLRGGRGEAQIEAPVDSRRIGIEVAAEQVQAKASSGAVPSVEELALRAVMAASLRPIRCAGGETLPEKCWTLPPPTPWPRFLSRLRARYRSRS